MRNSHRIRLALVAALPLLTMLACSADPKDEPVDDDESDLIAGAPPRAVGYILTAAPGSATDGVPWCVATLVAPDTIVSSSGCGINQFDPTTNGQGGGSVTRRFALRQHWNQRNKWIDIVDARNYEWVSVMKLASPITNVAPVALPTSQLGPADEGKDFYAIRVDKTATTPPVMTRSETKVLAVGAGQPFHVRYPTIEDFLTDWVDPSWYASTLQDAYAPRHGEARIYDQPLLPNELFTYGKNESEMTFLGRGVTSSDGYSAGSPLLRRVAGKFELLGVYNDTFRSSNDTTGRPVLGSLYIRFTPDILAFLDGAPKAPTACRGIPKHTGLCIGAFAVECFGDEPMIAELQTRYVHFCGTASNCKVKPYVGGGGTFASCDD